VPSSAPCSRPRSASPVLFKFGARLRQQWRCRSQFAPHYAHRDGTGDGVCQHQQTQSPGARSIPEDRGHPQRQRHQRGQQKHGGDHAQCQPAHRPVAGICEFERGQFAARCQQRHALREQRAQRSDQADRPIAVRDHRGTTSGG
jgi:hypothetical protein